MSGSIKISNKIERYLYTDVVVFINTMKNTFDFNFVFQQGF